MAYEHARATPANPKPWRDEKVLLLKDSSGFWHAVPGKKVITPGQTVTWLAIGCNTLTIGDPNGAFSNITVSDDPLGQKATATAAGQPGVHEYTVTCDGQLASGGSSPEVIIDP